MASRREIAYVVQRMYRSGWPTPVEIATEPAFADRARDNWTEIIEGLANRHLASAELRVDNLVSYGSECKTNLSRALDLAGWEPGQYVQLAEPGEDYDQCATCGHYRRMHNDCCVTEDCSCMYYHEKPNEAT